MSRRHRLSIALGAVALSAHASVAQPRAPGTTLTPGSTSEPRASARTLDRVVDSARTAGFAGVVLVGTLDSVGTHVVYGRAVGTADRATGRPHVVDEVWPWASVTKQVTAALVLAEVAAGRLALDAPAARYVPALAGHAAGTATLRQLLQHTTRLPNPDDTPVGPDSMPTFYRQTGAGVGDSAAAVGYCAGTSVRAPAGGATAARFDYNNCDYLVLGAVLARVTGRPYATLVRERIADPLGLRTVALVPDGAPAPVPGYTADGKRAPSVNLATSGAAGALAGTAADLLVFDAALASHRLVPPAETAEMWHGDPALGYAALGAWAFPARIAGCTGPVPLIERRGEFGGVQVRNVIAPTQGRAVVVFTNSAELEFGEVWQGRGLTYAMLQAALCSPNTAASPAASSVTSPAPPAARGANPDLRR